MDKWPTLARLLEMGELHYIDLALAEVLLSRFPQSCESAAAFLCYLSSVTREGHLCVFVNEQVIPAPKSEELKALIFRGVHNLSPDLIDDVSNRASFDLPLKPICRDGSRYYFQRNWFCEILLKEQVQRCISAAPAICLDVEIIDRELMQGQLQPEQIDAIRIALNNTVSIITGGPGTGKSYTAGELVRIFWKAIRSADRDRIQIVLAAPTGKAAANLQKSVSKAVAELPLFPVLQAKTVQSFLGSKYQNTTIAGDLILIDESSMIDEKMMAHLFAATRNGARLVLLGDPNQLPPVEVGNPFFDLLAMIKSQVAELKTCMRTELKSIVSFATQVNEGKGNEALAFLQENHIGVRRLTGESQVAISYALPFYSGAEWRNTSPEMLLQHQRQFCMLTPLRQGTLGSEALNRLFVRRLRHQIRSDGLFVLPVLLVKNDHSLELFNGETGILVRHLPPDEQGHTVHELDYALFPSKEEGKPLRKISAFLLPKYEYGYCLSVHKSQGSEFDHVLLLLPEGSENFGREVLYTAATRARKQLVVWGTDDTILQTIRQTTKTTQRTSFRSFSRFRPG